MRHITVFIGPPLVMRLVRTFLVAVQCLICATSATSHSIPEAPASSTWARAIGGAGSDDVWGFEQTSDGGWILAGETKSFGSRDYDAWVLKLDRAGAIQWQQRYGGNATDSVGFGPRCVRQTADGGYVVVGLTKSYGAGDFDGWIIRLDVTGAVLWQKTLGGAQSDGLHAVDLTPDGGIVCAGYTSLGNGGAWVVRLSPSGAILWQRSYGSAGVYSMDCTSDGGYFLVGIEFADSQSYADIWCLRLDPSGNRRWERRLGGPDEDWGVDGQQTRDGGFVVVGWTSSYGAGGDDVWVVKLSSSGNPVWQFAYGGTDYERPWAVRQTRDGGFVVVGETYSFGNGDGDGWILRLSANGTVKWQISHGGSLWDSFAGVCQNADGSYTMVGYTQSFSYGRDDAFVLQVPADGYSCPQISTTTNAVTTNSRSETLSPPSKTKRIVISPRPSTANAVSTNAVITDACLSSDRIQSRAKSRPGTSALARLRRESGGEACGRRHDRPRTARSTSPPRRRASRQGGNSPCFKFTPLV